MINKLLSLSLILIFMATKSHAQEELIQQLKHAKEDTSRLRIFTNLGIMYKDRRHSQNQPDLDTAKSWFLKALPLSRLIPDSSKYSKIHVLMSFGDIALGLHDIPGCKRYYMQSINEAHQKNETELEAEGWERLGNILSFPEKNSSGYFLKAIALYEKIHKHDKVVFNHYLYALDKGYSGHVDSALTSAVQTINKYSNTKYANLEMLYYVAARAHRIYGNLDKALYYALGGVRRMELLRDTSNGGTLYGELAEVYKGIGDINNAVYYYKQTIIFREKKNRAKKFLFEIGLSVVKLLIQQKKPVEALKYINTLEQKYHPDSQVEASIVAQAKAYCYEGMAQNGLAEKQYQLMMKGLEEDKTNYGKTARLDIARFYITQKKPQQAAFYLKDYQKVIEYEALFSKDLELAWFQIDSLNGSLGSAIKHFQHYKLINDSVLNSAKTKQIQLLQVVFETEKKNNDIKLFKSESLTQKAKAQEANSMRNLTLAGIILLLLFLGVLYNSYRFKQRKNDALNQLVLEKDGLLTDKDKLLLEKQWLLKEIHHRVKNNLAIVMGLLNRQSAYIDNDVALAAIQNSQNRMHSIALIHQKLYQSENLDLIPMADYIDELVTHLKDSFDLGTRVIFEKKIDNLQLDVSQAVPLGLIINEAVTNSIKYAYPRQSQGVIFITLVKGGADENVLQIKDNGPGLKKGFDPKKMDSMGMNLMRGLSKQLGGSFEMLDDNGVLISIIFKTEVFVTTSPAAA
jgi:two-component sensor histidine kinase